jgi:Fis family transcriptional regulator
MSLDTNSDKQNLHNLIYQSVNQFLAESSTRSLHELVLEQVEPPLLEATMEKAKYNQVRAAKILGVSRGTLRKKLKQYFDDKYCGTRGEE